MTIVVEGENSYHITSLAQILPDDREVASEWARQHVQPNPAYKWILGKYAEADRANSNKQFWALDQLQMAQPTITHAPMNILHRERHIVGAFTATEMIYPATNEAAALDHPYIEALAVFWKRFFPNELAIIEQAHNQGALFFSMECVAQSVKCSGDQGCGEEYEFKGPSDLSYCDHINKHLSVKELINPHFLAGGLIVPPAAPGWKGADAGVMAASRLLKAHENELDTIYDALVAEASHLDPKAWEALMIEILRQSEDAQNEYMPPGASPDGSGKPAKKSKKKSPQMWVASTKTKIK